MPRRLLPTVVVAFATLLTGCSELPSHDAATVPAQPLAFVSPQPSEADRVSYRLDSAAPPIADGPGAISSPAPDPPESAPESVPAAVAETRVAVVPDSADSIVVWATPSADAEALIIFDRLDEFEQVRAFRVLADRGSFYEVQVPMRPNGSIGYLLRTDVEVTATDQRILIDLSDRRVTVWNGGEVVFEATGTIGSPQTPTPTGSFYVRSVFPWYPDSVYGPWVIPLSAYSEAIDQINGGDAVVAIHGTQRPDLVGAAASLGCVRLENGVLSELAAVVETGAPVEIVP
jgi:hypothetical protein